MTSLQQLRYEALAAAVERATRPFLLRLFGAHSQGQPIEARVERVDGAIVEFWLKEVVLDGAELVGRKTKREPVVMPLTDVKKVWLGRLHYGRTAAVCTSTMAAGSAATVVLSSAPFAGAMFFGAVLGIPVAALMCVILNQFKVLSEWTLQYDRDRQA